MTFDEIKKGLEDIISLDTTEDNSIANRMATLIEGLDSLTETYEATKEEVQRLNEANTSLKAKNFDLLSKIGTTSPVEEEPTFSLDEAINELYN